MALSDSTIVVADADGPMATMTSETYKKTSATLPRDSRFLEEVRSGPIVEQGQDGLVPGI